MYSQADPEQLTVRDHLARDRTVLANERTLLAYARTAFALAAGGISLLKFFGEDTGMKVLGIVLLVTACAVALQGLRRFTQVRRNLRSLLTKPT